jgi:hypothetical protein
VLHDNQHIPFPPFRAQPLCPCCVAERNCRCICNQFEGLGQRQIVAGRSSQKPVRRASAGGLTTRGQGDTSPRLCFADFIGSRPERNRMRHWPFQGPGGSPPRGWWSGTRI